MRINDNKLPEKTPNPSVSHAKTCREEVGIKEPRDTVEKSRSEIHNLTILHTNDMHGHAEAFINKEVSDDEIGGLSHLGSAIEKERGKDPENTLLLDAGDISSGGPVSDFYEAIPMVDAMNQIGYDAMTVGNHDLDLGRLALENIAERARFPILSANLIDKTPGDLKKVKPYMFKQVGDLKVGILGLTTPDTATMLVKEDRDKIAFASVEATAKKHIPEMRDDGADLIVVLSHLGIEKDRELAGKVDGIDVIVGGHSHTEMKKFEEVNGTVITQAGGFSMNLGKLDLDVEKTDGKARVVGVKSKLIPINKDIKPDREVEKIIKAYADKLAPIMERVVGRTETSLTQRDYHIYKEESVLANFATDAIRKKTGADFCILSPSCLRCNINEGEIKVEDIHKVFPWKNKISIVEMKGKDIKNLMEEMLSGPANGLAISGMKLEQDLSKSQGEQIVRAKTLDGESLDPEKTYTVATRDWFADGNVALRSFEKAISRRETEALRDILINEIEEQEVLNVQKDGRIINLT
ncbi:MAG: bifunctional metallophosphatase/5'-nucleotidase [Candidatus Eremiobacteraeota bacterium]|nr:bifunctional metallophosphatase/5'-nucleotidase [Candidatus Eremiobacteraeota bacterium]